MTLSFPVRQHCKFYYVGRETWIYDVGKGVMTQMLRSSVWIMVVVESHFAHRQRILRESCLLRIRNSRGSSATWLDGDGGSSRLELTNPSESLYASDRLFSSPSIRLPRRKRSLGGPKVHHTRSKLSQRETRW